MRNRQVLRVFSSLLVAGFLWSSGDYFDLLMENFDIGSPALPSHPYQRLKSKHTNVAFLKTHKTASSTIQNLLFRFAENHNLIVALPRDASTHEFSYPKNFKSHFVHPHMVPANIITNHMCFNKAEVQRLMPNDTIYITILREPSSMFESQFSYYYHDCESFSRVPNHSLEAFLEFPWNYYRPEEKNSVYAHNLLTFDLGGDRDHPATDVAYARNFVAEVERVFSLVMIAEYFDESLVLLRHLLSWDLNDILYIKHNMRTEKSKTSLTPALRAKIREWNAMDTYLYEHFNASFWQQLSALGPAYVAKEVQLLQQAQEKLTQSCFGDQKPRHRLATQPEGVDVMGYELQEHFSDGKTKEHCLKLITPEVEYTNHLRKSQLFRRRQRLVRFEWNP